MKKQVKAMEDSDSIQMLQQRMDNLEMRMKTLSIKEIRPTKSDLKAMEIGKKEIREGKFYTLEQLKKRYK